ncbi:hypothetical protein HZH66_013003 [Vespula vulgaris]|uniref:Uncharacterized protein n=1 Tax=Vespula vulgaris TaxID=7454 RepID=A0A834J833_VESVU|nr:hypothetical protein HZH66_013003 [Vespula vulgaris]
MIIVTCKRGIRVEIAISGYDGKSTLYPLSFEYRGYLLCVPWVASDPLFKMEEEEEEEEEEEDEEKEKKKGKKRTVGASRQMRLVAFEEVQILAQNYSSSSSSFGSSFGSSSGSSSGSFSYTQESFNH